MSKLSLQDQWNRFVKSGYNYHYFTKELYGAMYFRGDFIAGYNREGFHNNRFSTVKDLIETLRIMNTIPELRVLLDFVSEDEYILAQVTKARLQLATLKRTQKLLQQQIDDLKREYCEYKDGEI